jgi:hypothetical protein
VSPTSTPGLDAQLITVQAVIYLAAPGPRTRIENLSLSKNEDGSYSQSSNVLSYSTLASADVAAHDHNFGGTDDNAPNTTLKYGTFYLLEYFGEVDYSGGAYPSENLNVSYSVNGVDNYVLRISLPLNFGSDN